MADRGFADCKLFYALTTELGFEYVIRLRGDIYVTNARGERRLAAAWVGAGGRARRLVGARVTDAHELPVGVVVCVHDRKMDEPWCLAASEATVPTPVLIRYYGKRWGIDLWQNRCYKSPDNRLCLSTGSGGALGGPFIVTEPPPPQTPPGGVGLTRRWVKKLVHIFPLPVLAAFAPAERDVARVRAWLAPQRICSPCIVGRDKQVVHSHL